MRDWFDGFGSITGCFVNTIIMAALIMGTIKAIIVIFQWLF